jgi:Ni2+-binding GTPase involved in maturation of urease and hydrogenase
MALESETERLCDRQGGMNHLQRENQMNIAGTRERAKAESWGDAEIVGRVKSGETALYEILMRRYKQRLYRVALAILRNDVEAEDVMQDAYVRAYPNGGDAARCERN